MLAPPDRRKRQGGDIFATRVIIQSRRDIWCRLRTDPLVIDPRRVCHQ